MDAYADCYIRLPSFRFFRDSEGAEARIEVVQWIGPESGPCVYKFFINETGPKELRVINNSSEVAVELFELTDIASGRVFAKYEAPAAGTPSRADAVVLSEGIPLYSKEWGGLLNFREGTRVRLIVSSRTSSESVELTVFATGHGQR